MRKLYTVFYFGSSHILTLRSGIHTISDFCWWWFLRLSDSYFVISMIDHPHERWIFQSMFIAVHDIYNDYSNDRWWFLRLVVNIIDVPCDWWFNSLLHETGNFNHWAKPIIWSQLPCINLQKVWHQLIFSRNFSWVWVEPMIPCIKKSDFPVGIYDCKGDQLSAIYKIDITH